MLLVGLVELMLHVLVLNFFSLVLHCTQGRGTPFSRCNNWNARGHDRQGRSQLAGKWQATHVSACQKRNFQSAEVRAGMDPITDGVCGMLAFCESVPVDRQKFGHLLGRLKQSSFLRFV